MGEKVWPSWLPQLPQHCINIHAKLFSPLLWHCRQVIRKREIYTFSFSLHFFVTVNLRLSRRCRWTKAACLYYGWNHYGWVLFQLVHYTNRTSALWVVYMLFLQCVVGLNYIYCIYTRFTFSINSVHQCFNSGTVATISMATSYYGMGIRLCVHPV